MKTPNIEVLDAICGAGKTQGIIKWMKENPQNKYLYISPMLSEVEDRIPSEAGELAFEYPNNENGTKTSDLEELLKQGKNISFTHALFSRLSLTCLEYIKQWGYILVVDEEISWLEPYNQFPAQDIVKLDEEGFIKIDEADYGRVSWNWNIERGHTYWPLKTKCDLGMIYCTKGKRDMFVLSLPLKLIQCCSRVILLTYGYDNSIMHNFMKMRGVGYSKFTDLAHVRDTKLIKDSLKSLIEFVDTPATRKFKNVSISSSWFLTSKKEKQKELMKAVNSIGVKCKAKKLDFVYTLKQSAAKRSDMKLVRFNYDDCFLACNTKATNNYADKTVVVHAYNRYLHVSISGYLHDYLPEYDYSIANDVFALNEIVQFIFRTAIRRGEKIQLCIMSERMERLFKEWLEK